ncbi:hypothetical protein T4A_10103 [Trichinella pseudospiralis]|uniref:MULE transposase domain-containing protein n=1 Tax=Trichinella pseudospiralis TaxID=6337 RepID=A0A0V1E7E0_TRIPS|nr:hypothetical protein T4A_10103 [Trichinella pseudospiralis]
MNVFSARKATPKLFPVLSRFSYPLQLDHNSVTKGVACIMSTVGKGVGRYCRCRKFYCKIVDNLISKAAALGVVRQPQTVICNFETALISTVQARFKSVHIQGCYFYFCQTVLRKVAKLGMQIRYLH